MWKSHIVVESLFILVRPMPVCHMSSLWWLKSLSSSLTSQLEKIPLQALDQGMTVFKLTLICQNILHSMRAQSKYLSVLSFWLSWPIRNTILRVNIFTKQMYSELISLFLLPFPTSSHTSFHFYFVLCACALLLIHQQWAVPLQLMCTILCLFHGIIIRKRNKSSSVFHLRDKRARRAPMEFQFRRTNES